MAARRSPPSPVADLVLAGVVTGARGLGGEVRIRSFTAEPDGIAAYGPLYDESGARLFRLRLTGSARDQLIGRFEGVEDRTAAEALKGTELFIPRTAFPRAGDEEYYHVDLIGLRVERSDGGTLGTVRAVHDFGAGDVLDIVDEGGASVMLPFSRAVVPEVDLAGRRIVVEPPPELADDANGGEGT